MNFSERNQLSSIVINLAMKIHSKLGPGLLESVYEECLYYEIKKCNIKVEKQKVLPLIYEEIYFEKGYRLDLMIENTLIIEVKSVDAIQDIHIAQILTYMKLSKCRLGLIFNFKVTSLRNGIKRVIL